MALAATAAGTTGPEPCSKCKTKEIITSVCDAVPRLIVAADSERRVKVFNTMAENVLGVKRHQVLERDIWELLPDAAQRQQLRQVLESGCGLHAAPLDVTVGERRLRLTAEVMPVRRAHGRPVGVLYVAKDTCQVRETEQRMHHLERLAAVGELAAGTVHELRNHLTSIKGFTQLIAQRYSEQQAPSLGKYCGLIESETDRMAAILSEFLTMARPRQDPRAWLDIGQALRDVLAIMYGEALLRNVIIDAAIPTVPIRVYGEANRLKEVFINLMRNAFQAMSAGGRLTIRAREDEQNVYIDFTDTGPGIAADVLRQIFQPFFTTKANGTGLGLAICQRTVSDHGGSIAAESVPGHGATFTVVLPRRCVSSETSSGSDTMSSG